ncbi:MAG: GNAT family N-acetyltransferase [Bacteroidales bacterium]|nr:GNAT family N-acetyltransferase [Bacteroidales bacterium]
MNIREADISDLEQLMAWRIEVLEAVFGTVPDHALRQANEQYYRSALADGSHIAVFAYDGDRPIGCGGICLQSEMPSPDNPTGRCAYLMNIYVRPAHRHQGCASAIVRYLTQKAQALSIPKIYLEATPMAAPLYSSLGFAPLPGIMKLTQ